MLKWDSVRANPLSRYAQIVNSPSSTGTWFSGADLDSGCLDAGVFLVALAGLEAGLGYIVSSFSKTVCCPAAEPGSPDRFPLLQCMWLGGTRNWPMSDHDSVRVSHSGFPSLHLRAVCVAAHCAHRGRISHVHLVRLWHVSLRSWTLYFGPPSTVRTLPMRTHSS